MAETETVAHGFIGSTIGIGRENLLDRPRLTMHPNKKNSGAITRAQWEKISK
jgi:hypothetical protein